MGALFPGIGAREHSNGSNEMTLASSNSLHQGLDPLPTQLFVAIADRPPVQQITERNRIKQRIIRVEVTLHSLPKMLASQEMRMRYRTLDFALRLVKTMSGREGSGSKTKSRALCPQYESGNHFPGADPRNSGGDPPRRRKTANWPRPKGLR